MPVLDNFTRANENPLSNGGQWGGDVFGRASHALGVLSNRCVDENAAGGNSGSAYWLAQPTSPDCSVSCVVGGTDPTNGNYFYQLFARLSGAGTATPNGYLLLATNTNATLFLYRVDAGAATLILTTGTTYATGDAIELRCTGSTIAAFKNGVSAGSVTDATYSARGNIGVVVGNANNVVGTTYLTSFSGSPFVPVNTVAPVVSGSAPVGSVLSTTNGTWVQNGVPVFTYQWTRDGVAIVGATASTYTTVAADIGHAIGVTVTNTDANGATAANSSNTITVTSASGGGGGGSLFQGGFDSMFNSSFNPSPGELIFTPEGGGSSGGGSSF